MDNDISYTVSQGYLRVSFICSGTGGRKHILCIIHHILCIITEGCHRVSFVCSGISGRKHILCIIHHILYIISQGCHRVFFVCSGTDFKEAYIMYYASCIIYYITEFPLSVQALVGGSSSAREDSETDCEVKKFAFKKKNGSTRLTLRIKKDLRSP